MNRLFIAHTHYIPPSLYEDCLDDVGVVVVPEFYPDLIDAYYGRIDYFNSIYDFISFFNTLDIPVGPLYFAIENIRTLQSVDELAGLKQAGVRSLQLFHHQNNAYFNSREGLTPLGYELLGAMEIEGIALDLSHLNDCWIHRLSNVFSGKIVVSHCAISDFLEAGNSRSGCISLKTLEMLIKMNALIGISFVNDTVAHSLGEQDDKCVYDCILNHFASLLQHFGRFNLCLGPDYFASNYFSKVYNRRLFIPECFNTISGYKKLYEDLLDLYPDEQMIRDVFWSHAANWYSG